MTEVVCAVLENGEGKVLACRRHMQKHLGGRWEFPGGKVEAGESATAALVREIREELGIAIQVGRELPVVEWGDAETTIRLRPFLCRIIRGTPRALEHEEVKWCSRRELSALDWAPADVPILREIEAF